ncbi:hypothetical protein CKALI_11450 [Corynebacterium kalinowskii]|uniref:Uncharacterized protein n=1 Tax=Corynebacterium kalinowskii TaxID=2675216 RepID=A0A6B8VNX7_9CORY|nr:hypothetical protein [Corynebacterium kalinowskii]QGU03134.1 hypothetical protein CKALI_11450 [Corynebacterium kalinowskii]
MMSEQDERPDAYSTADVEFALRRDGLDLSADLVVKLAEVRKKALDAVEVGPARALFLYIDGATHAVVDAMARLERRFNSAD